MHQNFKNKKLMSLATISKMKVNTSELINEKVKIEVIFGKKSDKQEAIVILLMDQFI